MRRTNIERLAATQRPEKVNASITGACSDPICFRLNEPDGLLCVGKLGADRERVAALPLGSVLNYNRLRGGQLAGRVF